MKLKNVILPSVMAAAMLSGFAHAADHGDISFLGAVTSKTCDIETEVEGAVKNLVQLGNVTVGATSAPVEFMLKLKDPTCVDPTATNGAFVTWNASSLDAEGVANIRGTATKASVKLKALNSANANKNLVNSSNNTIEFTPGTVKTDGGYKFQAELESKTGGTMGSVDTSAAFTVHYN